MEEITSNTPQPKVVTLKKSKFMSLLLVVGLFLQLIVGYLFFRSSYLSNETTAQFDNAVIRSGAWRIFGVKEYGKNAYSDIYNFDPDLYFIDSSDSVSFVDGFLHSISEEGEYYTLEVRKSDQEPELILIGKNEILNICSKDKCFDLMKPTELSLGSRLFAARTFNSNGENINYIMFQEIEDAE